jgi:hypothetical protein
MKTYRTKPWMCHRCGYMMDACSPTGGDKGGPDSNSIALCLNCTAVYEWAAGAWTPLTPETRVDQIEADTSPEMIAPGGECCFDDCIKPHRVALVLKLSNGMVLHTTACANHAAKLLDGLPK